MNSQPAVDQLLWHEAYDPPTSQTNVETVVLLHGLTGSHFSWTDLSISGFLSDKYGYHVLVPDLPGHSGSAGFGAATLANSVTHLAALIRAKAHDGKAHVVGFSYGGYVALSLARGHPELVRTLFVSGAYDMLTGRGKWTLYLATPANWIGNNLVPRSLVRRVEKNMGLDLSDADRAESEKNSANPEVSKAGWAAIKDLELPPRGDTAQWQLASRTLLIAATKPMHDPPEATLELGKTLVKGNKDSRTAFLLPNMPHPWQYVDPQLFAQTVDAWIKGDPLPSRFDVQRT